jgi:retinol dehydrogenase 12
MADTTMSGKVVLITGATNGIGEVAALELAKKGATIILVGRDASKTQRVADEIRAKSRNAQVDYLLANLSSMSEVRRLASEFRSKYDRLDVLINNAGAVFSKRQESVDGYELTFALNHLAYFLLTHLLLDMLKTSAPSRIVNVSSDAHKGWSLDFDDLQNRKYRLQGFSAYCVSKLENVLFTYELARQLAGTNVTANALHPGSVATGFAHNNGGLMGALYHIVDRFSISPEKGAETIIYLASSPDAAGISGKYWYRCEALASSPPSYDEASARRLWEISEQLTGVKATAG